LQPERYIGLAGLGFMGRGIARCLIQHGFHVVALDPVAQSAQLSSDKLTLAESAKDLAHCEVVLETITENFESKQALYDELEAHVGPAVPIASNTSGFPITRLQAPRKHPNRFAGMHWSSPAYASAFLEIIRGEQTDDATVERIGDLALQLEKEPGLVRKDLPGFVVNRIAYAMYREALHLVEEGVASIEDIDSLCRNSIGIWMPLCGPFRWMDISGGPALYSTVMETIVPTLSNQATVPETMLRLRSENKRGTQSGEGFYHYQPGDAAEWDRKLEEQALKIWAARGR
jgi:3-hydroxybutyryl-CoA dehydrogenase